MSSSALRIMVVEDDVDLAESFADSLRDGGHDVSVAGSAGSAMALAKMHAIDAVLLDLGLPDAQGFEVARSLRGGALSQGSVILVVTAREVGKLDEADAAGVDLVVNKPVSGEHLGDLIQYVYRRRNGPMLSPRY